MKKTIIKLLIIIWIISTIFIINNVSALDISGLDWIEEIKKVTIEKETKTNIVDWLNDIWYSILDIAKWIIQALLVVYIIYVWWKMIMSMWADDWELTKAKSQLRYSLIAVVFINVPWVIYDAITHEKGKNWNVLINMDFFSWKTGLLTNIIDAIEVFIFIIAIYVIVMAGIKMMTARWRDEKIKEGKEKLLYSIFAMIFVWFIEAWKQVAMWWANGWGWIKEASVVFSKAIDMALLFAGPVAMIFLTYAWYIYITANWDDEKVKKAKSIIINTLIATVLLLVMVTFLNDLTTLI